MGASTDIDIDFPERDHALAKLPHVVAAMTHRGERVRHKSGVYFQAIPIDPIDGLSVLDFHEAADKGFFKIDFLQNYIYRGVRDEAHLVDLLTRETPWELFDDPDIVASLAHVRDHYATLSSIKPRSIEDLAVCLALVRPGKKHLIGRPRAVIDREIWLPCGEGYYYKRGHAIAYAASIVVQLNLLVEQAHQLPD